MFTHTHNHAGTLKKVDTGFLLNLLMTAAREGPHRLFQYEKQSKDHAHSYMCK